MFSRRLKKSIHHRTFERIEDRWMLAVVAVDTDQDSVMIIPSRCQAKRQTSGRVPRPSRPRRLRLAAELLERRELLAGDIGTNALGCGDVTALNLTDTVISRAVQAAEHCKVSGVIDETINFRLELPSHDRWNGKFLMLGNGGYAGVIPTDFDAFGLQRDYAVVATDTGHVQAADGGASWGLNNPKAQEDWGHRAVHLTAAVAKDIIRQFYDSDIQHSYFVGGSGGGRQAMMESQRYPEDFDGILALAPAADWIGMSLGFIWNQQSMYPDPANLSNPTLPSSKLRVLNDAVLSKCDALDGLEDGLISDPTACDFSPADDLQMCPEDTEPRRCRREFLPAEISVLQRIFDGPSNSAGQLFPGFPVAGEYTFWDFAHYMSKSTTSDSNPSRQHKLAQEAMRYFVFDDPNWRLQDFDFETDVEQVAEAASIISAKDPDLNAFKNAGGKLIIAQGWADPAVSALATVDYYGRVVDTLGGRAHVDDFMRLFLLPGRTHAGGSGPGSTEWLTALEMWVEQDVPPDALVVSGGTPFRTRPICAYPSKAVWDGEGHPDSADSFRCTAVVTVDTDQDIVDAGDGLTSLREAIAITNNLAGADEIRFDLSHDGPTTIQLVQGELKLADAVTITGPGRELLTIDAHHRSRIFNITAKEGDFAIEGLTLAGGRSAVRSNTGGMLTLRNSAITHSENTSGGSGASISTSGDVTIESSIISGNTGSTIGGNVVARGNVSVSFSTITENSSGGVRANGNVTILSSTLSQNGDDVLEKESVLAWPIPGIIDAGGDVTIDSSTISRNSTTGVRAQGDVSISSSTISGNRGGVYAVVGPVRIAGGIHANGDVTITSSTISGNMEGGITAYGNATIKSSTITGNLGAEFAKADRRAGVAFFRNLILENSIVAANQGGDFEFAPCVYPQFCRPGVQTPEWTVRHSLIGHNLGTPLVEAPLGHPDSNGNLIGGPVGRAIDPRLGPLSDNGGSTLTHALLHDSPAIDAGDPTLVADISLFEQRGEPYQRIQLGRVDMGAYERQNLAAAVVSILSPTAQSVDAVTIEFARPVTGFDVSDLTLSRNVDGDLLTGDERLTTTDNQTFVLSGLTNITDVPGFYTLRLIASGSEIAANDTPLDSSASMSWTMGRTEFGLTVDTLVDEVDGRIDDGDISLRDALAFAAPGETITFAPSLSGGTLLLSLGEIWITRGVTVDATALPNGVVIDASGNDPTADVDDGLGSRVLVIDDGESFIDTPVTLRGLILTGGDVDSDGGAILTQETLSLEATSILKNSSIPMDSFSCCRGAISGSGDVMVSSSTISANVGHGINTSANVTVQSSTISKNSQTGLSTFGKVVIDSSTISENDSNGIVAGGPLTITSSTISGNSIRANRFSAGIGASGPLTIRSSTITENHGGVSASGQLVSITNSILAGNRGDNGDLHLWFPDTECCERTLIVQHSLIGTNRNNELPEVAVGTPDANGNLLGGPVSGVIDPRLGPLAANGGPTFTHALLPDSPAIGMGDPLAGPRSGDVATFDQRGVPYSRVVNGRVDMGAFERGVAGDANGDDKVDFADFLVLSAHFGTGQSWSEGNFDGSEDGTQFADFLALSANFGFDGSRNDLNRAERVDRLFSQFA